MLNTNEKTLIDDLQKVVSSKEFIANILANCAIESNRLTVLVENFNYSAEMLLVIFPKHFKDLSQAINYHRHPQLIANRVYADRMGNGDENSGDGWKFRGRGIVQLTGRFNYTRFSKYSGFPAVLQPEVLEDFGTAIKVLFWFLFVENQVQVEAAQYAEDPLSALRKVINGGHNGLEEVKEYYEFYLQALKEIPNSKSYINGFPSVLTNVKEG